MSGHGADGDLLWRLAQIEARFRDANEAIRGLGEAGEVDRALPFVCECVDVGCTKIIRVSPDDYDRVREHATHFLYAAGHEEGVGNTVAVETLGGVLIVRKTGASAGHAEATDPRR